MIYFALADETHTAIVAHLLADLFEEVEHTPDAEEIAAIFEEIESDDRHSTLLAFDEDGDAVGIITVAEYASIYARGLVGAINELYVVPEYRSEGVGKILLDEVRKLAESRDWKRIEVTTPGESFEKTMRFYLREGFMEIGPRLKLEI